jgi:CHASE3 domain sensor protein
MSISSKFILRSTSAFLFVGFMALMAIVVMNFWLGERAQSIFEDASAARDTRIAAVELRNAMQTAESSQRGFIITGNEIYLAPYQAAKIQAQHRLAALQLLLPSYAGAGVKFERLDALLTSKFDELDRTIALKRDKRDEDALAIIRTNSGKALTDEANVFFRRDHRPGGRQADVRFCRAERQYRIASSRVGDQRASYHRGCRKRCLRHHTLYEGAADSAG